MCEFFDREACVSFPKTNKSGRIARAIFFRPSSIERGTEEASTTKRWESVEREKARQADFQSDVSRPSLNIFFISTSREQITTTFGLARPFTLSDDIYLVVFTKDEEFCINL